MSSVVKSSTRRGVINGDVDESLFGLTKAEQIKQRKQTPTKHNKRSINKLLKDGTITANGDAIISSSTLTQLKSPLKASFNECVTISNRELDEIKSISTSQRELQQQQKQRLEATQRSELAAKARARKDKMLALNSSIGLQSLDNDEERFQYEDAQARHKLLTEARQAIDENHDDVKHMNQMVLYAQTVTIRDAQILEKQKRLLLKQEEEKKLDKDMELERIRTIELQQERERQRAKEQREGASVIVKQIEERELSRIRSQELREQEAAQMLEKIKEAEELEEKERLKKIEAGKKMLAAVVEANNEQAKLKLLRKAEEIEEDLRIADYIRYKEQREFEEEQEKQRIKAEKEKEIARLRAEQERAQDRQSQIDELRARRYQEQRDRKWRETEAAEARKRALMKAEIAAARDQQQQEKARRITESAIGERDEYARIIEWQTAQADIDKAKQHKQLLVKQAHAQQLKQQMEEREKAKSSAKQAYLKEGKHYDKQMEADRQRLLKIKAEKLAELERIGVPEKYRAELARKKVLVAKIH